MKKLPHISEAEYQVMKIIWKYAPISTTEVIEKLVETVHGVLKQFKQCY